MTPPAPPLLALRDVSFRYRSAARPALAGIDLALAPGTLLAVLGATGAGKSTLCRLILGLAPELFRGELRGTIEVPGGGRTIAERARTVGMVFQDFEAQLFTTEVTLEVAFGPESFGVPPGEIERRVDAALGRVGLAGFRGRAPSSLSGGEKQRLAIAAAIALEPEVLVLDEPTTDLDPLGKADVLAVLRELRAEGRAIVLVEHETEELGAADRVVVLEDGRIAAAGGRELLAHAEALERRGVRPPEIPRLFARLGLDPRSAPIEDADLAARALGEAGFAIDARRYAEAIAADPPSPQGPPLLEAQAITHVYEGATGPALDQVSLAIAAGDFVAILGGNGSGKSTLARHLAGLLRPTSGTARFDGRPVGEIARPAMARDVGYVFQNPDHQIFSATIEEEVAFGPRNFGLEEGEIARRVARALATVGLAGRGAEDPFALGKGDRQRLAVASVLSMEPRAIIMDEPTTGLDHRDQLAMMALLAELNAAGRTIVVITHHIWIALAYARRIVLLAEGRVIADGPARAVMADLAALARARVAAPPLARLGLALGRPQGIAAVFRNGEEAARCVARRP